MRALALSTSAFAAIALTACGGEPTPTAAPYSEDTYDRAIETIDETPQPLQEPGPMIDETDGWPEETPPPPMPDPMDNPMSEDVLIDDPFITLPEEGMPPEETPEVPEDFTAPD